MTWVMLNLVLIRLETVLVSVQDRCTVCAKHTIGSFSVHLEIVLIMTQDRCTVCAKRTIGSKSFWTHPMELLGDTGHVKSCFGSFGDGVSVCAR